MQLKAIIKRKAKETNISAQLVMQNYMLERLLERISLSKYRQNFIIKGGFLISSIVGLDTRATMDLDATIKGLSLSRNSIKLIFLEICNLEVDDDIVFEIIDIHDIREGDIYPGIRVALKAIYKPINVTLTVDVTTGDIVTPKEIEYTHPMLFDNKTISVLSYNIETILSEKIETVLSRNTTNTRSRDFYDIFILHTLYSSNYDISVLSKALVQTTKRRGSVEILNSYQDIIKDMRINTKLQNLWKNYQYVYDYAKEIDFNDICDAILYIMDNIVEFL